MSHDSLLLGGNLPTNWPRFIYNNFYPFRSQPKNFALGLWPQSCTPCARYCRGCARGRDHIVAIGSVAGLYPIRSPIYGASKGAVRLASQNLRLDLAGSGVRATEICPGRVVTEFLAGAAGAEEARRIYDAFAERRPKDIADAILYTVRAPWRVDVSTIEIAPTEQAFGGIRITPVER